MPRGTLHNLTTPGISPKGPHNLLLPWVHPTSPSNHEASCIQDLKTFPASLKASFLEAPKSRHRSLLTPSPVPALRHRASGSPAIPFTSRHRSSGSPTHILFLKESCPREAHIVPSTSRLHAPRMPPPTSALRRRAPRTPPFRLEASPRRQGISPPSSSCLEAPPLVLPSLKASCSKASPRHLQPQGVVSSPTPTLLSQRIVPQGPPYHHTLTLRPLLHPYLSTLMHLSPIPALLSPYPQPRGGVP